MADSDGIVLNDVGLSDERDMEPLLSEAPERKRWRLGLLVGTLVSATLGIVCFFAVSSSVTKPAESKMKDWIEEGGKNLPNVFDDLDEHLNTKYGEMWMHQLDYYKPKGQDPPEGGFELVLILHGMSGEKRDMDWWCDKVSGTDQDSHSKRACASLNWIQKDGQDVEDILRVVQYFVDHADEKEINPDKIVLFGLSGGAALTLEVALDSSVALKIAGAVIVSGISPGSKQFCNKDSTKQMLIFHSTEDRFLSWDNVGPFLDKCKQYTAITFKEYHGSWHTPTRQPDFWDTCTDWLATVHERKVPGTREELEAEEKEEETATYPFNYIKDETEGPPEKPR
jgi:dienelactone hydrolase